MKNVLIFLICSCFLLNAKAQSGDSLQVQLARKWTNSKAYALKLVASMPEEYFDFKPVPEEMSFREQVIHIAENMKWLSSSYLFVNIPKEQKSKDKLSKLVILKMLGDAYDFGLSAHSQVTVLQLDEQVKFFAGPMTRRQILLLMHDHQTHHLGQLIVYLRLKGVKPPNYVGW